MTKRILITGGAGFIAHHVIKHLIENTDWEIVSLDRLDFSGNLNRLAEVMEEFPEDKHRVKVIFHDLKAQLNQQIITSIGKVNYIIHLAAASHVDRSIEYPLEFVYDNIIGTANILEYARSVTELEKFIYFSTDEVFGPAKNGQAFKEYDRYNSTNPYSATKAAGEELVVAYHNTYSLPAVITHTMNVFGERQHPEKFIPKCINKIQNNETIEIHSNKNKTTPGSRFYIHAGDVASALYFILCDETPMAKFRVAATHYQESKIKKYNIVGAIELDNLQLAHNIADIMKKGLSYELVDFHSSRPGHDLRYALDGSLMKNLGWSPRPIEETLKQTVKWTLENNRWLIT
jgi:dTDP-glucose 4,6-dehydratase